jgi:hypothetical protein
LILKSCECGCTVFNVNKKDKMLQCVLCKKKYIHQNYNWIEFEKKKKLIIVPNKNDIIETFSNHIESLVEWKKRFRIEKIKKKKVELTIEEKDYVQRYEIELKIKQAITKKMWEKEINYLQEHKIISFNKNEHKGKLRGKNIAIKFHRDLNTIEIKNKISFRSDKVFIEIN